MIGGIDAMNVVNDRVMDELLAEAAASPRGRAHRNLHPTLADPVQRFCMAGYPGSYFRPHRHPQPGRWELFTALRGCAALLLFSREGIVEDRLSFGAAGPQRIVEIPPLTWHTLVILEAGTVLDPAGPTHVIDLQAHVETS